MTMQLLHLSLLYFAASSYEQETGTAPKVIPLEALKLTGQALVDYVNKQNSFKATYSPERTKFIMPRLMRKDFMEKAKALRANRTFLEMPVDLANVSIPERFDAREAWPDCPSITYIRDQSACGSCWAVSAAETISDRICIHSKGKIKMIASDTDILACCGHQCGMGCEGGWPIEAWRYVKRNGVCSGGRFGTTDACKPYAIHPCGRHVNETYYGECPVGEWPTPACKNKCQPGYKTPYRKDKIYAVSLAKSAYYVRSIEKYIQHEIMTRGPVQATFDVYEDFMSYTSGIYEHLAGEEVGAHAVKIIGWGEENGKKYWIIANSWNTDWGEDHGYFRMIRGVNDCKLESQIVAGIMDV